MLELLKRRQGTEMLTHLPKATQLMQHPVLVPTLLYCFDNKLNPTVKLDLS